MLAMSRTDVVQVELVGGWADLALPVAAILISLATLAWTIWVRERDRARLKVEVTSFYTWGPLGNSWYIAFEATNVGYVGSTVVTGFLFRAPASKAPKDRYLHVPESALPTATLPKTLPPGESVMWVVPIDQVVGQCKELGITASQLVPCVATGHRTYEGKWKRPALDLVEPADNRRRKWKWPW